METTDLNAKMAELLGAVVSSPAPDGSNWRYESEGVFYKHKPEYATDANAFRTYVLPKLDELGLLDKWAEKLHESICGKDASLVLVGGEAPYLEFGTDYTDLAKCLSATPAQWTEATIAVLGGG